MIHTLRTLGLLGAVLTATPAVAKQTAKARDLGTAFGDSVCEGTLGNKPDGAWQIKIFDAQLEGRRVTPIHGQKLTTEQMQRKAKTLARLRGAGGYAAGVCKDGSGWAVAMPAPVGIAIDKLGRIKLPTAELQAQCESYRADFAARSDGVPKTLALAGGVMTTKLGDGVVGVTCQPKAPRWRGPTLWYLIPTGQGPAESVPEGEVFAEAPAMPVADLLAAWVNRVRLKEGLKALEFKAELTEQAGLLSVDGSLSHDRAMLKKTAKLLEETAQIKLLGEDRVRATDAMTMAWLWWNSPRHRHLILNDEATVGGLAARAVGGEHLAVLAVAKAAPLQTAKAATPKKKHKTR